MNTSGKRILVEKEKVNVVVNMLRLGLHSDLEQLKVKIYESIRGMALFSDIY